MVWGFLFAAMPISMYIATDGDIPFFILIIFIVIGGAVFIAGIKRTINTIISLNLQKSGNTAVGKYLSHTSVGRVNGVAYYKINFNFRDDDGNFREATTLGSFTHDEVERYRSSRGFTVRYKGNMADIDPKGEILVQYDTGLKPCEYCGSLFEGEKCPYCGATRRG